MKWMMKNSSGHADGMFSMAVGSWIIASLAVLASLIESVTLQDVVFKLRTVDNVLVLGYISACFSAYVVRRNAKLKKEPDHPTLPGGE